MLDGLLEKLTIFRYFEIHLSNKKLVVFRIACFAHIINEILSSFTEKATLFNYMDALSMELCDINSD